MLFRLPWPSPFLTPLVRPLRLSKLLIIFVFIVFHMTCFGTYFHIYLTFSYFYLGRQNRRLPFRREIPSRPDGLPGVPGFLSLVRQGSFCPMSQAVPFMINRKLEALVWPCRIMGPGEYFVP